MLPRTVFLFGFENGVPVKNSFNDGKYTTSRLMLLDGNNHTHVPVCWSDFIDELEEHIGYKIPYVDAEGNLYMLLVDAIGRKSLLLDSTMPLAMVTRDKVFYADLEEFLVLPDCFY